MHEHAPTTDRQRAIAFLVERIDYERTTAVPYGQPDFRLDRMRELLARLDNPHLKLPTVHVAGTKGKGSTAAMIAAMLTAAGYRTGLYSSPHLDRLEERLAIDGRPCGESQLVALVERIRPVVAELDAEAGQDGLRLTYFEVVTALAFLHFASEAVDAVVLEVGLGGRLDSTNVCQPLVSVITSISFDHTKQLGSTLAAIAGEKAGIIKPHTPVVSGVVADEPRQVIVAVSARQESRLVELGTDFSFTYRAPRHVDQAAARGEIDFAYHADGLACQLEAVQVGLLGEHQGANAAVALAVAIELRTLGWNLPDEALRSGLASVVWPARVEVVARRPTVVLDAAHNVASIEALVRTLAESFDARPRLLLFATTQDKDVRGMLQCVLGFFDRVVLTQYQGNPRGVPLAELARLAVELGTSTPYSIAATPALAWQEIQREATAESLICVAGSFFIAAEIKAIIAASKP